jgi:hypothetical protein
MSWSRIASVRLAVLIVAALLSWSRASAAAEKPNIIFMLSDDLAMGDVGVYGQKLIKTPRLDRMAAEGTRSRESFSGTSLCATRRSRLMTGVISWKCESPNNSAIES